MGKQGRSEENHPTDLSSTGVFAPASSINIGDPYVKKLPPDARTTGKQLVTSPSKRGQVADNWSPGYYKVNRLYEGEKYVEPWLIERKERVESSKKNLTKTGFIPSSPPKARSGLGSFYGCVGGPIPYEPQGTPPKQKPTESPKQIVTSPAKKGTFGYAGITLSKSPEYLSEPYDEARKLELKQAKEEHKKRIGGAFKSTSKPVDFFDSQPNVAASKVFTSDKELPPVKHRPSKLDFLGPAFYPSHTPHEGFNAAFSSYPEHQQDPYDAQLKKSLELTHESKKKVIGGAWKPTSTPKTTPQPSISARNITLNTILLRKSI